MNPDIIPVLSSMQQPPFFVGQASAKPLNNSVQNYSSEQEQTSSLTTTNESGRSQSTPNLQESIPKKGAIDFSKLKMNEFFRKINGIPNQDGDSNKWKIPGTGNVSLKGQEWFAFELRKGGFGPINYLQKIQDLTYAESKKFLIDLFNLDLNNIDEDSIGGLFSNGSIRSNEDKTYSPPVPNSKNLSRIKHYLQHTRGLDINLLNKLIDAGTLYADEYSNCIFNAPGIAEVRSIIDGPSAIKKLVPGSKRKNSFSVPYNKEALIAYGRPTLAICEAAIDAISFHSLFPWATATSTAGAATDFAVSLAQQAIDSQLDLIVATDNDLVGHKIAQTIFNHFFLTHWLYHNRNSLGAPELSEDSITQFLQSEQFSHNLSEISVFNHNQNYDMDQLKQDNINNMLFFSFAYKFENPDFTPFISFNIKANPFNIEPGQYKVSISKTQFDTICAYYSLYRQVPLLGKDWNEYLIYKTTQEHYKSNTPSSKSF